MAEVRGHSSAVAFDTRSNPQDRRLMRQDGSPLALAFHDPLLRGLGLNGDTYGDSVLLLGSKTERHVSHREH